MKSFLLALSTLLTLSCAQERMITLPDGRKLKPSPTYLSPSEMAAKGKNSFGVPETSFAFYPEAYKLAPMDVGNKTRAEWDQYVVDLDKAGQNVPCKGFAAANTPQWDKSNCDPPAISHDCFSVERLFVVPWGSGGTAIGKKPGGEIIYFPAVGYSRSGKIIVWDRPRHRNLVFDQAGTCMEIIPNINSEPVAEWDVYESKELDAHLDKLNFLLAGNDLGKQLHGNFETGEFVSWSDGKLVRADISKPKGICRVYLPYQVDLEVSAMGVFAEGPVPLLPAMYPEGYLIYPRCVKEGLEILRYSKK